MPAAAVAASFTAAGAPGRAAVSALRVARMAARSDSSAQAGSRHGTKLPNW